MLNICSSVQDPNQSTIHKDSDWTSQKAKKFYWSLGRLKWNASERNASERNASEESAPEDTSSEASHQKPLHQSWQSTVYEVYNH